VNLRVQRLKLNHFYRLLEFQRLRIQSGHGLAISMLHLNRVFRSPKVPLPTFPIQLPSTSYLHVQCSSSISTIFQKAKLLTALHFNSWTRSIMAPTLDIEIQNRTQSNQVFAYVTGRALERSNHVCFIQADGKTPYFPESPSQICSLVPKDCAIKLGAPGTSTTVTIPQLAGGRIWFSIDKELTFLLNPGPAIVEPSISNVSDPNINILWDFCEFTFANNQIYANISYVDFVSLSVALTLIPQDGAP
jgi:hypothetical protein